jgi:hypothetical protein
METGKHVMRVLPIGVLMLSFLFVEQVPAQEAGQMTMEILKEKEGGQEALGRDQHESHRRGSQEFLVSVRGLSERTGADQSTAGGHGQELCRMA